MAAQTYFRPPHVLHRSPLARTCLMPCAHISDSCVLDTWLLWTLLARTTPCPRTPCPDAALPYALGPDALTVMCPWPGRALAGHVSPLRSRCRVPIPRTRVGHTCVSRIASDACPWPRRGQARHVSLVRTSLPRSCYLSYVTALFHIARPSFMSHKSCTDKALSGPLAQRRHGVLRHAPRPAAPPDFPLRCLQELPSRGYKYRNRSLSLSPTFNFVTKNKDNRIIFLEIKV